MIGRITWFAIALLLGALSASLLPPISAALLRAATALRLPLMQQAESPAGTPPQRLAESGADRQENNTLKLRVRPGTHDARAMRRIRTMAAAA